MNGLVVKTVAQARKLIIGVIGTTVLLAGIVMLATPGPGWVAIFLGLSILSVEFVWAARLLKRLKDKGRDISNRVLGNSAKQATPQQPPPSDVVPPTQT
ncbi:MAG: PGPGW domain-containing protein [Candidatus Binataceae bacterium]